MAQYDTPTQLSGLFKEVYADKLENLIPDNVKVMKAIPFVAKEKHAGNKYHQPVILSSEHGVTFAAFDAGAYSLNTSIAMTTKDAQVSAAQILVRANLSVDAANRAATSKNAFIDATELLVQNTMESISRYTEMSVMYGQSGIGVASSSVNTNATTTVVQLTTASWAAGIWTGAENEKIQFFNQSTGAL